MTSFLSYFPSKVILPNILQNVTICLFKYFFLHITVIPWKWYIYIIGQIKRWPKMALCNELTYGIHSVEQGHRMVENNQPLLFIFQKLFSKLNIVLSQWTKVYALWKCVVNIMLYKFLIIFQILLNSVWFEKWNIIDQMSFKYRNFLKEHVLHTMAPD